MDDFFWLGILFGGLLGGVIGYFLNWFFKIQNKEEKWDSEFQMDKQRLNRFLEKVKFEIELILEKLPEKESKTNIDTLYLRRLLYEDPFTLSFGDKNLEQHHLGPVQEARDFIEELKVYIAVGDFDKTTLVTLRKAITKIRVKILGIEI